MSRVLEMEQPFIEGEPVIQDQQKWYRQPRALGFGFLLTAAVAIAIGVTIYAKTETPAPAPPVLPVVVSTWFPTAVQEAYNLLSQGYSALDAVELGCTLCEDQQCDGTVGWGGSPDTSGETTLDALIMDAETHQVGAVTYLRRVRHAINVARKVMAYTQHTLLAGDGATNFSLEMGLPQQDLHSQNSIWIQGNWTKNSCQPNFWANLPGVNTSCPPYSVPPTPTYTPIYSPIKAGSEMLTAEQARARAAASASSTHSHRQQQQRVEYKRVPVEGHDTIGMCALDVGGKIAVGGSSNGATHKLPGRSSDISLIGAGAYADKDAGCAAATGDGDITMRFLPAYQAVEFMRNGMTSQQACEAVSGCCCAGLNVVTFANRYHQCSCAWPSPLLFRTTISSSSSRYIFRFCIPPAGGAAHHELLRPKLSHRPHLHGQSGESGRSWPGMDVHVRNCKVGWPVGAQVAGREPSGALPGDAFSIVISSSFPTVLLP